MRVSSLRWGIILTGIGLFFLGINFGYLSYYVWVELLALWPILLIAIGLELTFRRSKLSYIGFISPFLILLTFIYVAAISWDKGYYDYRQSYDSRQSRTYTREVYNYEIDRDPEIKRLNLDIDFGMGELWIGPSSDRLFSGDFEYRYRKPRCSYDSDGNAGKIRIRTNDSKHFNIFNKNRFKNDARIFVANYVPLKLDIDIGAAYVELDFSELIIDKLNLNTGAAKIELRLGCQSKDVSIEIDSGASKVTIVIPREMGLEVDSDAALSSNNFRKAGLEKYHGKYRTDNYNTSDCKTDISIDSGVSRIEIKYY